MTEKRHKSNEDRAEEKWLAYALEAAEERFNVLFRESSDPILIISMKGEILSANGAFEQISGLRSDELFRGEKGWGDFVFSEDLPVLIEVIRRCAQLERDETIEFRMKSATGFFVWFEQSHSILHDENGRPRGIMAVARDITSRKEREMKLREEAQVLQRRHERAQELITRLTQFTREIGDLPKEMDGFLGGVCDILFAMYRPALIVIWISKLGRAVYRAGVSLPAAVTNERGEPVTCGLCQDVEAKGSPLYLYGLRDGETYGDDPLIKELGVQTFLGAPLRDSAGSVRGALALFDTQNRDFDHLDIELLTVAGLQVAARLRAGEEEESRRTLEDHLRQAQKMEAVGMLAGGIAHDFNNILSGILGFTSYLISKTAPESEINRHLSLVEKSALQAAELTRRLLSFSRRTHFAKERLALNGVVQEVLAILEHTLPHGITITQRLDPNPALILGDRSQMSQVVMNLCLNAAEAMGGHGGTMTVTTESRPLNERERAQLVDPRDDDYVCLTVADTGKGIDPEVQAHIFDPFFTTKTEKGGTGLGLSIVYGIVSNHGGDISVESTEGEGSRFTVYLPVASEEERPKRAEAREGLEGSERILVVEDENIVRQMVVEILEGHGYEAVPASSGDEAVKILLKRKGKIDLVLLDMIMPGMDGEQTFLALREIDRELPILLTSGFAQGERCARLMTEGARGLVRKPYTSHSLVGHIREALDRKPGGPSAA